MLVWMRNVPHSLWHLNVTLQLVALFGEAEEAWPCWRKCLTLEAGFETQPFPDCSVLHACSSRSKPSAFTSCSPALALASWVLTLSSLKSRYTRLGHGVVLHLYCLFLIGPLIVEDALSQTSHLLFWAFQPWLQSPTKGSPCSLCQRLPCCADLTPLTLAKALVLGTFIVLTFPHESFPPSFLFPPNVCLVKIVLFCFISVEILPEVLERQNCGLNGATCRESSFFFSSVFFVGWCLLQRNLRLHWFLQLPLPCIFLNENVN